MQYTTHGHKPHRCLLPTAPDCNAEPSISSLPRVRNTTSTAIAQPPLPAPCPYQVLRVARGPL